MIGKGGGSRTWRLCAFRQRRDLDVGRCTVASAAPEPKAKNDRRRGVAELLRGGETPDQPHNRHVPTTIWGMTLHVEGLRWHDPISVVGAPSRSECYGVVAPTHAIARVPRIWGRGIRNAAHPPFRSPFYIEFEERSGED